MSLICKHSKEERIFISYLKKCLERCNQLTFREYPSLPAMLCTLRTCLSLVTTLDKWTANGRSSVDSSSWFAMWEPAAMHYREREERKRPGKCGKYFDGALKLIKSGTCLYTSWHPSSYKHLFTWASERAHVGACVGMPSIPVGRMTELCTTGWHPLTSLEWRDRPSHREWAVTFTLTKHFELGYMITPQLCAHLGLPSNPKSMGTPGWIFLLHA